MSKPKRLDFSLSDYILLAVSVAGMILFGSLLVSPSLLMNELFPVDSKTQAIGHVASHGENVRRRLARSFHWYDIYDLQKVFENDSILTGDNSEARIELSEQDKVLVKPNSLVKVSSAADKVMIDLQTGSIDLDITSAIHLKYKGKTAKVQVRRKPSQPGNDSTSASSNLLPAKIKASINDDGNIEIKSQDNDISVKVENKVVEVESGEKLRVTSEAIEDEATLTKIDDPIELKSPIDEDLWTGVQTKQVQLKWQNKTSDEETFEVSLYRGSDLTDPYFEDTTQDESYLIEDTLEEGDYSWQVESGADKSEMAEFTVIHKTAPNLELPYPDYTFDVGNDHRLDVFFKWQDKIRVDNYRVQISTDLTFIESTVDKTISGSSFEVELPSGTYYWRVSANDDTPIDQLWSEAQIFHIAKKQPRIKIAKGSRVFVPDTPDVFEASARTVTLEFSENADQLRELAAIQDQILNPPTFYWYPVEGATKFKFEVSRSPDFANIEYSALTTEQEHTWTPMAAGQYFWRVRAETESGKSPFTSPEQIAIRLPAPKFDKFRIRRELLVDRPELVDSISKKMHTNWSKVPLAELYSLRVWKSGEFENYQLFSTSEQDFKRTLASNGDYFVQVAAIGSDGRLVSDYSTPQKYVFDVRPKLLPPKLTTPLNDTQIVYFDDEISSSNSIIFSWTKIEKATSYEVELSRDKNFARIDDSLSFQSNSFLYQKDFHEMHGDLYWRVRSKAGANVYSSWSSTNKITVKPAPTFDKPRPLNNKVQNLTASLVQ